MKLEQMKNQALNSLRNLERAKKETPIDKRGDDWATWVFATERDSERILEIVDIAEKMTDDEKAQIRNTPVYKDDVRFLKPIKIKYNLSWNELKMLIRSDI